MLVHVMNPTEAHSRTVLVGEAMTQAMLVKWVNGAAAGDEPKIMKATPAEMLDPTVMTGVVVWVPENDLTTDFAETSPSSARTLTLNSGSDGSLAIPSGVYATFWYNLPVLMIHTLALDAGVDFAGLREGDPVAFKSTTSKLTDYDAGEATQDVVAGFVYRNAGKHLEVLIVPGKDVDGES